MNEEVLLAAWTRALGNVALVEFVALAFLAVRQARRHHARGAVWAAVSFSVLGAIAVTGKLLERFGPMLPPTWLLKVLLAAVLAIPFCFYRFAAAFKRPPALVRYAAVAATVGAIGWTVLLPSFPSPVGPRPSWFVPYRTAVCIEWAFLFSFVVVRLWHAGAKQSAAPRARMRLLAAGAAGLDLQIVLSALGLTVHPGIALAGQIITVVMAALFALGLTLPTTVRSWSRRHEMTAIQDAIADLIRANSPDEVAESLLPHVAAFVGASRVTWVDAHGGEIAAYGDEPAPGSVQLCLGEGSHLVAWTSPYIPFFAADEIRMLRGMGHLLANVLERFALADRERGAQEALVHQALHDSLTGLPNRTLFLDRLGQAAAGIERHRSLVAVMFIDLDHFKMINDGIDHAAGDAVLVETAARLSHTVRSGDTVARFGGDEFVVFAEVNDEAEAMLLAGRLRQAVSQTMLVGNRDFSVSASIGVVIASHHTDAAGLVRDADTAMYQAKDLGRDRIEVFTETVRTLARERLDLDRELRQAISNGQMRLHYQPIVRLSDGRLTGFEALVRWDHPERGLLPPSRFIPMAEESGLIVALDAWVMERAAHDAASWCRTLGGGHDFTVWVNKSAGSFHRGDPVANVRHALTSAGLDPSCLGIEITESVFMSGTAGIGSTVADLKALGVSIAIDDFGTGFSSLGYLKRFPIDVLKIDSSFVSGIGTEPETSLVTACLALAESLSISTVAEGVETASQRDWLVAAGCAHAQGYLFSHPLEPEEAARVLRSHLAAA